jgi:regulator of sirC expression with transglutaminase-like and TPR domain
MTSASELEARWARCAAEGAGAEALAEGALLIAAHAFPELDIDAYLARLDSLAATLRGRLRADIGGCEMLVALNRYLFQELGFRGNSSDYYDPRNSYLNEVIERRLGIPISLSVLYIAAGRRLGLELEGISFPGHFLVKCRLRTGVVILDPYAQGASLDAQALRARLDAMCEEQATCNDALMQSLLRPATVPEILSRMLRNLKAIYERQSDPGKALWAADRIVRLLPGSAIDYRERARLYLALECCRAALADLRAYAALAPKAAEAEGIGETIAQLERRAERLN